MYEVAIIMVVALIILGPRQLTEVARGAAKLYREIQKLTWDIRNSIDLDAPLPSSKESTTPTPTPTPTPTESSEPSKPAGHDLDINISQDKNSGPDFYADLLEASKEEEEAPEQSEAKAPQSTEVASSDKEQDPKEGETKDIERT